MGIALACTAFPLAAQTADALGGQGEPPERIDLLEQARESAWEPAERIVEECAPEDVDVIAQTITVCRRRRDETPRYWDQQAWEADYARRTMGPMPIDTFGIPDHGVTAARGCFIPPCPPPPALIIDVAALPEAPPGSDAERVGRGLAPDGNRESVSPSGSASPEGER